MPEMVDPDVIDAVYDYCNFDVYFIGASSFFISCSETDILNISNDRIHDYHNMF